MDNISIEEMPREIDRLLEINEKLQARIDKSIEFISKEEVSITALDKGFGILNQKDYLLDILKGSDKE